MKRSILFVVLVMFMIFGQATRSHAASHVIKIQRGDTLRELCVGEYGIKNVSYALLKRVSDFNGIKNPDKIFAGKMLKFPELKKTMKLKKAQKKVQKKLDNSPRQLVSQSVEKELKDLSSIVVAEDVNAENDQAAESNADLVAVAPIAVQVPVAVIQTAVVAPIVVQSPAIAASETPSVPDNILKSTVKFVDISVENAKLIQAATSSAKKTKEIEPIHFESMLEGFFGCDDILSECKGGRGEIDLYKKLSKGNSRHSLGLNLMAFGAFGEISEFQLVWHKIYGGGGISYKYVSEKNHLVVKEDVLFQSLEKTLSVPLPLPPYGLLYKSRSYQSDLLFSQSLEFLHRQNDYLYWGADASFMLPITTLNFSSQFDVIPKSNQSRGEFKFIAQQKINNNLQLRENFSPVSYQGESRITGMKASVELRFKERIMLEAGALAYPYGITNELRNQNVRPSDLTMPFFGLKIELGKEKW